MTDKVYPGPYNGSLPLVAGTAENSIAVRDSAGRLQAVAPSAAADLCTKTYVDFTLKAARIASGNIPGVIGITVGFADLTTAGTSQAVDISATVPANAVITDVWCDLDTVFAGGTISAMVVQLGDAGDPNGYMADTDVFTGATLGLTYVAGAQTERGWKEAAHGLIATFTSTAGNVDTSTTGSVIVYFRYWVMPV